MQGSRIKWARGQFVKILVCSVMLINLGACAAYSNKFDCPVSPGAYCSSVEEIERMINNGSVWKLNKLGRVCVGCDRASQGKRATKCSNKPCPIIEEIDNGYIGDQKPDRNS